MSDNIATPNFIGMLLECQQDALDAIADGEKPVEQLRMKLLGSKSELAKLTKQIRLVAAPDRAQVGSVVNQVKQTILQALAARGTSQSPKMASPFDPTMPGIQPPNGHLHIITQAIEEITRIFERISFTRVRHPEVDWDWYPFESLNMPHSHPASDEWETFYIENNNIKNINNKFSKIVLTPHTSNGQVREMEKKKLPIRMINIAKCYRRQIDVSHTPMFHQFEGLYIDTNVSIGHLKGVLDYFAKQFFGPQRKTRIRPFHFQFTEPSFEVDVSCGVCGGTGFIRKNTNNTISSIQTETVSDKYKCKLCKEGWLELGGAGMVHPTVLKNGTIDTTKYNGFAFGWGVERCYMMKSGTQLDDIRLLYNNDVRFLEQF